VFIYLLPKHFISQSISNKPLVDSRHILKTKKKLAHWSMK